ncbi:MAG TPA: GTP pyrophosphokinase family protein [Clostridiales bacterium]|nr:GTP pyrophosphokinase family protein [Clostridiales bacterium]
MNLPQRHSDLKDLKKVMFLYDSALKEVETKIEILNNEFKMAHKYNPIEHIASRIKTPQSIAKKLRHNNKEYTIENVIKQINEIAGIRIICSFKSDIFRIADSISKQNDVTVLKIKDYITNPKSNGYSSYHMIISVPIYLTNTVVDTKVEIQIRTIAMDYWASLEHKIYYKFEGNAPMNIREELRECADVVAYLDEKMLSINEKIERYNNSLDRESDKESLLEINMKESFGHVLEEDFNVDSEHEVYKDYPYIIENKKAPINEKKDSKILNFFKLKTD